MPDKPTLYRQETDYSCVPACLRMALESLGVSKTEEELRALCDCTALGTRAGAVVEAARSLGFSETRKYNLDIDSLKDQLQQGHYPIVYIYARLLPDSRLENHAVIVIEISESHIKVLDPARGELALPKEEFEREWGFTRRLAILIK